LTFLEETFHQYKCHFEFQKETQNKSISELQKKNSTFHKYYNIYIKDSDEFSLLISNHIITLYSFIENWLRSY